MKQKVLNWSKQFDTFCFLDNHQYQIAPHTQECLVAVGAADQLLVPTLAGLQEFMANKKGHWLFGHLGYDLKNEMEGLQSSHPDHLEFPDVFFFEPRYVIQLNESGMTVHGNDPGVTFSSIERTSSQQELLSSNVNIQHRIPKDEYLAIVERLKQHILRGDCYELNFCQEFFSTPASIDPLQVYQKLSAVSPNPFSCLYRLDDKWLLCASPERYLKKQGSKILSQPIKGTSKRVLDDEERDEKSRRELKGSLKDRTENVMIVDLVRNDLSKICEEGSVFVEELFGVYSFPQVHQMISTVAGTLKERIDFTEIVRATFPMGSMTGAPKRRVMELIGQYERSRRGIFSGAVGYISPQFDFDFNVVIRSIMYNEHNRYVSFQAGSAITYQSDAAREWDECMLKAEAMKACF